MNPSLLIALPLLFSFSIPLLNKLHKKIPSFLVVISTFINMLITFSLYNTVLNHPIVVEIGNWNIPFGINLYIDKLSLFSLIIITVITFLISVYNLRNTDSLDQSKFNSIYLLAYTGIIGIVLTGDIFNLFVFIEIASISTYVLATMKRKTSFQAAFKYLVLGAVASVFLLISIGLIYSSTGSLNMAVIAQMAGQFDPSLIKVISILLLIAIGLEAELFPMNLWVPEVYSKSHIGVTSLLSGVLSLSGIYMLIRVFFTVFNEPNIYLYLKILGIITLIFGEFVAYQQENIKKMLAYSSIAQMGLVVTIISFNTAFSLQAGLFHLLNHSILKVLLFISVGFMIYNIKSDKINDLSGLGKKMPFASIGFTIGALGIMGVPFLSGFVSKMMIIQNTLSFNAYLITGLILLATLVEVAYYLKVIQKLYFESSNQKVRKIFPCLIPIGSLSIFVIYIGLNPQPVISFINQVSVQIINNSNYIISILGGI